MSSLVQLLGYVKNMLRRKNILWLAIVLLTVAVSIAVATFSKQNQETITIAVAAPLTKGGEATETVGKSMVRGAELYIKEVNSAGGIQGKQLKLQVYDDQGSPKVAEEVAQKIVQSKAIAVLGHYSSSMSLAAGKIYQANHLPAISGSATADAVTQENDWYFRTVFSDSFQGKFIANYLKKVLGYSKIALIRGYDAYGLGLGQTVETAFRELGGEVVARWQLPENQNKDTDLLLIKGLQQLKQLGKSPDCVVLTTNRDQVTNLIREMKLRNLNFPLFGGDDLGDVAIAQILNKFPEENNNPGFFTNGLYATVPFIFDVADDQAQKFRKKFEQVYRTTPGWSGASYYDATSAIVEAIKLNFVKDKNLPKTAFSGKNLEQDRQLVRESLAQINSPETAIQGGTRKFYFNQVRTAAVPIAVGLFDRANLVSAFSQLQILQNQKIIANLKEEIASGEVIPIGEQYLEKVDVVYTGLDVNEVSYLDEKTSTYVVDFYVWFRYRGKVDASKIEFGNYGINRLDSGEKLKLGEPIQEGQENGVNYKIYRVKADFHEEFDFHNYPFDKQHVAVRFRHANLTRDKLIYAIDLVGMRDGNTKDLSSEWRRKVFREISSWTPIRINFYQDTLINDSTLGYRKFISTNSKLEYSQFNAVIDIKRDLLSFSIKNLLPLWFFLGVAYLLLFLPFEQLSVEALSGLLLAIVFYHLSLLSALPDGVGYVVALDYAFYLIYILLGLELVLFTVGHQEYFQKSEAKLKSLVGFGRGVFAVMIFIGVLLLYWVYF